MKIINASLTLGQDGCSDEFQMKSLPKNAKIVVKLRLDPRPSSPFITS